jgi:nucleoside-diphosphate kinase
MIERNVVHGSDGPDTAAWEIGYFFKGMDLLAGWVEKGTVPD